MQDQNQTDSNGATGAVGDAGSVGTDSSTDAGSPADDVIVKPMTDDTPSADASNTASEDDTKSQNAPTGQTDGAMNFLWSGPVSARWRFILVKRQMRWNF